MNEEEEYENGYEDVPIGDGDAFANVAQGLSGRNKAQLVEYWQQAIDNIERIGENGQGHDTFKSTALPLARIKKVMKTDSDVRMISAEAPILFAKGCDIFITELTMRAWIHAEESKRRTLQRSDIATALQKSDMFDFLIDIVPREEAAPRRYHANPSDRDPAMDPNEQQQQHQASAEHDGQLDHDPRSQSRAFKDMSVGGLGAGHIQGMSNPNGQGLAQPRGGAQVPQMPSMSQMGPQMTGDYPSTAGVDQRNDPSLKNNTEAVRNRQHEHQHQNQHPHQQSHGNGVFHDSEFEYSANYGDSVDV